MKLHLTGSAFQYDTAVDAVLDLRYTRHFLHECGGGEEENLCAV